MPYSPQSKNTDFKGVLRGQFALANVRAEQSREGRDMLCFQFRYTPLPSRQTGPIYLSKSMMVAVPTHPRAVIKADTQFQQKEDAAHDRRHPLNQLFGSVLVHFQQDLEQLFLLFGCLGRKKFITLERDISAATILSTQLLKQFGHRENEADIKSPRFVLSYQENCGN